LRSGENLIVTRLVYTSLDGYRLFARYVDDNGRWRSMAPTSISDGEHFIEVLVEFASSPSAQDGRITYWVDDVQGDQDTGVDLYDTASRPSLARLGAVWISQDTTHGTLYLDEFVLHNDSAYIGPVAAWTSAPSSPTPIDPERRTPKAHSDGESDPLRSDPPPHGREDEY
jgi:hypothetical protein